MTEELETRLCAANPLWRARRVEDLRAVVGRLCDFVWNGSTREHLWSIPPDASRDFDLMLSDAIDELQARRDAAGAALAPGAATSARDHRVAEIRRRLEYRSCWCNNGQRGTCPNCDTRWLLAELTGAPPFVWARPPAAADPPTAQLRCFAPGCQEVSGQKFCRTHRTAGDEKGVDASVADADQGKGSPADV